MSETSNKTVDELIDRWSEVFNQASNLKENTLEPLVMIGSLTGLLRLAMKELPEDNRFKRPIMEVIQNEISRLEDEIRLDREIKVYKKFS